MSDAEEFIIVPIGHATLLEEDFIGYGNREPWHSEKMETRVLSRAIIPFRSEAHNLCAFMV